jgi:hypothetical protein
VIELPPPRQVQAERRDNQIKIRWRAGREQQMPQFSGYQLFIAKRSLVNMPVRNLPSAIALPDTATSFSFASTDTVKLFIHLRSRAGKYKISLPSLPEVMVPPK